MVNMLSGRRRAILYLLAWLVLGSALGAQIVALAHIEWVNGLIFTIPVTIVYAIGTGYSVHFLCRAYPLAERTPAQIGLVFAAAAGVSGLFWAACASLWNAVCLSVGLPWIGIDLNWAISASIFGLGIVLYWFSAVLQYLLIEYERTQLAERRELESKLLAQDAELRMLRTQIDPHFLFNSLHSISALTTQDATRARQMTLQLADFFRKSLRLGAHEKISLEDEMALTEHFLAIEKIRFGARMNVETSIDDAAKKCLVPPLITQPLVENAVKHGIGNLMDGGTIRIAARSLASILRISIENTIDPDMPNAKRNGVGLNNVRQRLAAAYGRDAQMNCLRRGDLFQVEIHLPAKMIND